MSLIGIRMATPVNGNAGAARPAIQSREGTAPVSQAGRYPM